MRIIKKARQSCRVSHHQQLRIRSSHSAQNRLKDLVRYTGCLIDDIKHMVRVKALQRLRVGCCTRYREPLLRLVSHIQFFLRPDQIVFQCRVASHPLADLRPQNIIELVLGRCRAWNLRKRSCYHKPKNRPGLHRTLTDTVSGSYRGHVVVPQRPENVTLLIIWPCMQDVLDKINGIIRIVQYGLTFQHRLHRPFPALPFCFPTRSQSSAQGTAARRYPETCVPTATAWPAWPHPFPS